MKPCILYEDREECIECGDCRCELDPDKICDNCMQCETGGAAFRGILIDGIGLGDDPAPGPGAMTEEPGRVSANDQA